MLCVFLVLISFGNIFGMYVYGHVLHHLKSVQISSGDLDTVVSYLSVVSQFSCSKYTQEVVLTLSIEMKEANSNYIVKGLVPALQVNWSSH